MEDIDCLPLRTAAEARALQLVPGGFVDRTIELGGELVAAVAFVLV